LGLGADDIEPIKNTLEVDLNPRNQIEDIGHDLEVDGVDINLGEDDDQPNNF